MSRKRKRDIFQPPPKPINTTFRLPIRFLLIEFDGINSFEIVNRNVLFNGRAIVPFPIYHVDIFEESKIVATDFKHCTPVIECNENKRGLYWSEFSRAPSMRKMKLKYSIDQLLNEPFAHKRGQSKCVDYGIWIYYVEDDEWITVAGEREGTISGCGMDPIEVDRVGKLYIFPHQQREIDELRQWLIVHGEHQLPKSVICIIFSFCY